MSSELPIIEADTIGPGAVVALYFTHADGSHSACGSWRMPEKHYAPDPRIGGDTLGEAFVETCLNADPGENGDVFVPVVSAEIVQASRILTPWALSSVDGHYVREVFGTSIVQVRLPRVLVEAAKIDTRKIEDERLIGMGFKLL